jgi:leucyl aminopeptidase
MKISQVQSKGNKDIAGLVLLSLSAEDLKASGKKAAGKGAADGAEDARSLDRLFGGALSEALKASGFKGKAGETFVFRPLSRRKLPVVAVIGRESKKLSQYESIATMRKLGAALYDAAAKEKAERVSLYCAGLDMSSEENYAALLDGIYRQSYTFESYKKAAEKSFPGVKELRLHTTSPLDAAVPVQAAAISEATSLARDLVNMPPCDCTPAFIVKKSREIASRTRIKLEVLDRAALKKLGANALLSVSKGSAEPPFLVKLTYRPAGKARATVSLVGKGVTFDSGGLSIKPAGSMESMKCDMAGAAAALGAMQALATLKPDIEIRAYLPLTENVIGEAATRPGDIVKAMSGKSIEILNTDAEGRLILADALCLAERDKCDAIIDLATLTGACVVALGTEIAAVFSDDDKLCERVINAGAVSGERFWRLPLEKEYQALIKSSVADIKNTGGRWGGAITGALFLKEFVEKTSWAHLDIAGPAFVEGDKRPGAMGFGVATLVRCLMNWRD